MKTSFFVLISLIGFLSISLHQCGHIYSQPSEIVPQNALAAKTFHFFFMLETQLAVGDYLFIKFPMLVTTATAKISTSMDPTVAATIDTTARADPAVATTETRFFAVSQALSANTWYRVVVTIGDASNQAVGVQGCVWFATTSYYSTSAAPTYITYDENRCFDVLSFAPTIDTTNFKVTGYYLYAAANTYKTISGTYNANFDITPSQNVGLPGATFVLTINGGSFTFTGTCTSIACTSNDGSAGDYCPTTNLTALPSSAYTCTISSTAANTLTLVINQAVITNTTRIQVGIQAPTAYISSVATISATFKSSKAPITFATTTVAVGSVNGIDLRTDFTTLSLTGTQKLLWGVVPSGVLTGRSSGYSGCPIVLYASGASVQVFNSLQTSFTLTTAIKKMTANTGIQALWTLMDGGLSLASILYNSLYTTMPGTIAWAFSADVVTVTGITDLSATTYYLGVKFSVDVTTNAKAAALSTVTSPSTQTVGGVSIKTGDGNKVFATITGTQISIKKNMEYQDSAVQNTGDGVVKLYNQVFSYWVDSTKYVWTDKVAGTTGAQNDALTYKKYFLGQVASTGSAAAVWPKPSGATNNQALLIQLKFGVTAICVTGSTDYLSITLLANCALATGLYTPQIGVLLKVVFNNGMLNIPDGSYIFGAKVIGTLFPGASPGTNYLVYDDTRTTTTGPIGNTIIKETASNFWHLSISCLPQGGGSGIDSTCYSATTYVSAAAATDTFSALAFINTNIAKYPTMYADAYVLDFIVCFKIAGVTTAIARTASTSAPLESASSGNAQWQLVEEGCSGAASGACTVTAGPGLINGYVISGMVDTAVKTSIVNGYVTDSPAYGGSDTTTFTPFIPAYLRLGVTITSPVASASTVAFFIGATSLLTGISAYASTAGIINIIDTVGSATTAVMGKGAPYDVTLADHWWAHYCLIMSGAVTQGTSSTLNYYVPIQTSFASIKSLNLALLGTQSNGQYPVNGVYRVFGGIVSNNILLASPTYSTVGATLYHSVSAMANANAATYSSSFVGSGSSFTVPLLYWDVSIGASTTTGCFSGGQSPSTAPQMNPGSGNSILPSKSISSGFYILTDVANPGGILCNIGGGNTGTYTIVNTGPATLNTWGEAFIVYVRESTNIFAASTPSWDYANTNTNKCYFHTIVYSSTNIYTIFCTTDFYSGASFGTGSKKLALASFTVPFYWGANYVIKTKINYAWSSNDGTITAFNGEKATTSGWTFTGCTASDSLSLAQTSYDVPITITLTSSNGVIYNVASGKTLSLTISASASTFYSECTHASLACSIAGLVISLNNPGTSAVAVAGSSIVINGWVDTGATGSAATYNVQIAYDSGSLIETCAAAASGGFQVSGTALVNVVTLSSFSFMANQGARGVWSFSFNYPRIIRNGYDFALNVGALAGPTTGRDVANYRCMILQNGAVSNAWSTLTSISSSTFVSTVTSKTLFSSGGTFTYKCLGGGSPDGTVVFSNLASGTVERGAGGTKVTASSIPTANQYTITTPSTAAATLSTVSLTKFFNTRGFESDYIFSFIPVAANITTSGRIVVEFSQSIPPKFNRLGRVDCFLNETPVFCESPSGTERMVQVWPNMVLSTLQTYSYVLRIAGVTQPNSLGANDADSNKKIFFALSSGSDPSAGLTEQAFLTETWDASLASSSIASILIHDFSYQVSKIRSSTSFTYVLNFPASTFTTATVLWVQLPPSVVRSIFYGSSPSFSFVRVGDSTSTNLVSTSAVLRAGRVAVAIKADAVNAVSCNYTLTINGIATPQMPPQAGFVRDDFKIYVADSTNTTVLSSTASGSRNTSTYISWNTGSYSAAQLLFWYDPNGNQVNMVDVSVGTYQTLVFLSASMNIFSNTFTFAINGGNSSAFLTAPKDPSYPVRAVLGSTAAPVYIAAKTGTAPGAYYVSWSSTDTTGYSPIQNLDLRVVSTNCTPTLVSNTFNVPFGGTSDPITVDFSKCIPVADVTIMANVTSGFNMTNPLGISLNNQQTQSQSLAWSNMNGNYRVSFYAISQQGSNGTNTVGAATISFTMSGTNGANINSPGTVTINLVQASTVPPVPLTPTISSSVLSVGCDQSGSNFFALATFTNAAGYNITYINSQTQAVNVPVTKPASNDPTYTVFGYVAGLVPPSLSSVNLAGYLKSGGNLTVYSFCQSNSYVASTNASTLNWLQPDNGGQTISLKATFKTAPTSAQKVALACALAKNLLIASKRVLTDEGKWCTTLRFLQNTTNSTNTTNTTNTTTANTTQNATYSTYFYILKDYLATNDSAASSVQANILSSTYLPSLISSIGDSSFPSVSSVYMTGTIVNVTTNANGDIIKPVVNYNSSVTDTGSINATFTLTNMNGVVYAGVEPNVNTSSLPNATNLVQGLNGLGVALTAFNYSAATQNVPVTVSLTGLTNNTQYLLYYVANNMDISYNGLYSAVVNITVSTNAPSSSFGSVISISMMVLAAVFLALFGMI